MKKIFVVAVVAMLSVIGASAQNSKKEAVERYLRAADYVHNVQSIGTMPAALVQVTDAWFDQFELADVGASSNIVKAYMESSFLVDAASSFMPYFMDISIKELNAVSKMMESSKGKIANEHSQMLNDPDLAMSFIPLMEHEIVKIISGKEPRQLESGASQKRKKLVKSYLEESSMVDLLISIFDLSFNQEVAQDADPVLVEKVRQYCHDNIEELYLIMADGIMTNSDFAFFDKLLRKTAYSKIIDAMGDVLDDPETMGMSVLTNYANWFSSYIGLE